MTPDRSSLDIAAPALCTVGALVGLLAAVFGSGRTKSGVLAALFGTVGSAAWLATALDDRSSVGNL
ncbi:MAG: hypothetical protein HRT86_03595 [Ilumatobacteraceae bacterium]|nr:hypothetical protein [Ilumatobacteraceae bacterium]